MPVLDPIPTELRKLFAEQLVSPIGTVDELSVRDLCTKHPDWQPYLVDLLVSPIRILEFLVWIGTHPDQCYVDLADLQERLFMGISVEDFTWALTHFPSLQDKYQYDTVLPDMLDRIFVCPIKLASATGVYNVYLCDIARWIKQFKDLAILLPRIAGCLYMGDFDSFLFIVQQKYADMEDAVKELARVSLQDGSSCAFYVEAYPKEYYDFFNRLTSIHDVRSFIVGLSLQGDLLREAVERIYAADESLDKYIVLEALGFPFADEFVDCLLDRNKRRRKHG